MLLPEGTRVIFTAAGRARLNSVKAACWMAETHIYIFHKYSAESHYDLRNTINQTTLCVMSHWIAPFSVPLSKEELSNLIKKLEL